MTVADWTFQAFGSVDSVNDHPPGGSDPCIKVTIGSGSSMGNLYPTAGTVNGTSVQGIDYGSLETWFKFVNSGASSENLYLGFRITDTTKNASLCFTTAYTVAIGSGSGGSTTFLVRKVALGGVVGTLGSANTTRTIARGAWNKVRVRWYQVSGSELAITVEIDFNDGNGYIQQGTTMIDTSPQGSSLTNTVGFGFSAGLGQWVQLDDSTIQAAI